MHVETRKCCLGCCFVGVSKFRVLHTPVTSALNDLAICTANVPTPPDAPFTRTFYPEWICPLSRRPCRAVSAATGMAAASSNELFAGFNATVFSGTDAYSAQRGLIERTVLCVRWPLHCCPPWHALIRFRGFARLLLPSGNVHADHEEPQAER